MKLIETKTLASNASAVQFSSIPQDATDLYLTLSLRPTDSQSVVLLSFNSNTTTADYTFRYLIGSGSSVSTGLYERYAGTFVQGNWTANTFSNSSLYIPNYTVATNKTYSLDDTAENNATAGWQLIGVGRWASTAAINSITFTNPTQNIAAGSTISLYTITRGSGGAVVS